VEGCVSAHCGGVYFGIDAHMKLYIWNDPYRVPYGGSHVYVVADTVEQARDQACSKYAITMTYGSPTRAQRDWTGMNLDRPPDQIFDLPCAVWDEWSE
jgi:hypothetical protein